MQLFRVTAEKTSEEDCLVFAENSKEAEAIVYKAFATDELKFEEDFRNTPDHVYNFKIMDIDASILHEIKSLGVLTSSVQFEYDMDILNRIVEEHEKLAKEENLKKNHLEFKF